ncbi:MAG: DUF5711 family protein [Clostridia bacterium]
MSDKFKISMNKKILKNLKHGDEDGINILNSYKEKKQEERQGRLSKNKKVEKNIEKHNLDFKVIILVIVVIILFFVTYIFLEYAQIIGFNIFPNNSNKSIVIDGISGEDNIYKMYNNDFLIYSNNTLVTYDTNGKKNWEYKISENFIPCIYINKSYMVIANKISGNIYVFSGRNEITNKKIDGTIDDIYLDEFGNIAVEYSSSGYKKIITVLDKYGKNKYTAYVNSSSILDIKLIDKGNKLILIQTDSSSLTIGTKISIIDSTKEESIKELIKLENKLVYDCKLINDNLILITNDSIINYNISKNINNEIHSLDSNQTNYISLSTNYFVAIETNKNKYNFISNKFDNTSISNIELEVLPKFIKNSGFLTYIVSENKINVVNKWGIIVKIIDVNMPPKDIVIFNKEKSVALIYSNRVEIVNL